jgi:hypothetical protein
LLRLKVGRLIVVHSFGATRTAMSDYYPQPESEEIYDVFLYGSVADQDNGTPISVLTALARGNCDPWEEAARLARLPADRAERELVELLNRSVGRKLSFAELESAAKRLVPLLPFRRRLVSAAAIPVGTDAARQLVYWAVWFGIVTVMIVAQAHDRPAPAQSEASWTRSTETAVPQATRHETESVVSNRAEARTDR